MMSSQKEDWENKNPQCDCLVKGKFPKVYVRKQKDTNISYLEF